MQLVSIHTETEIRSCYETYHHLRPHLSEEEFVAQVLRQMQQGFQILAIEESEKILSVVGFRMFEYLAWGKIIYIDDLVSHPETRGKGYASTLLQHVKGLAIANGCKGVHLDSGYHRHAAHKVYLNNGFILDCHHFALKLE